MVCNYCFSSEQIKQFIKENGIEAEQAYQCPNCQKINNDYLIEPLYILLKVELAKKLQQVIQNLYEHEAVHGLYGRATMFVREDGDEPNDFAGCLSLQEVCEELFEDEDNQLAQIISSNVNIRNIKQGGNDYFSDIYSEVWKDKCWFEQDSLNWEEFSKKTKHSLRFFDTNYYSRINELQKLNRVFESLGNYSIEQEFLFRARGIKKHQKHDIKSNPLKELGQAPAKLAGHNRFSPSGISYIYLAFDKQTAMDEIYENNKKLYALGKFELKEGLNILNLKKDNFDNLAKQYTNPFDDSYDSYFHCSIQALTFFIKEIQKPISDNDKVLEYLPTQILAEYIRLQGFDGFIFNSSKNNNGVNIVVFENKISNIIDNEIIKVGSIFNQVLNYFKSIWRGK
jgi:hypothetical protein